MLKIDISEKENKALVIAGGTLLDISSELTYAINDIYTGILSQDQESGKGFKELIQQIVSGNESPLWAVE